MYNVCKITILLVLFWAALSASAQEFAQTSVLSSGIWHKVSVSETGMYTISRKQLAQMGFDDLSKVRVFGAGGRQLDFVAGADSRDDLVMLPCVRTSNGLTFFAEGPDAWTTKGSYFVPVLNNYSKKAYYFVTSSASMPQSDAALAPVVEGDVDAEISEYSSRRLYAVRTVNIDKSGRNWLAPPISLSNASSAVYDIDLPAKEGESVYVAGNVVSCMGLSARSANLLVESDVVSTIKFPAIVSNLVTANSHDVTAVYQAKSDLVKSFAFKPSFSVASERMWISYMAFTSVADLKMSGSQFAFRNLSSPSVGRVLRYSVSGANSRTLVWDVTDPSQPLVLKSSYNDGVLNFVATETNGFHEYVAFDPDADFAAPTYEGQVANHNLHSHKSVNYLVVCPKFLSSYGERLGRLHESMQGLSWRVVDVDDVYDEFSAGRPEAPGLRNYIKMLYERGKGTSDELRYVLLLGEGSYDNFDRSNPNNLIPTYESEVSYGLVASYATDDFYGWLEDGTNVSDVRGLVSVGVGRLPVVSSQEAEVCVGKIERYMTAAPSGEWRSKAMFVGCAGDNNEHVGYAERQAEAFEVENPDMETIRVFSESFARITTSTGYDYPEAVAAFSNVMQNGCLLMHYTGHGGSDSSGDGYMSIKSISSLANGDKANFLVAATCTFGPFDQMHNTISHAALFNPNGGSVGLFVSNREVYGNGNFQVTRPFVSTVLAEDANGTPYTVGDAMRVAKNNGPRSINTVKYHLWGDPALVLQRPRSGYVKLQKVNGVEIENQTESLKALSRNTIECAVLTDNGDVDSLFNGKAIVTLFDKRSECATSGVSSTPFVYSEWKSRLFSGSVDVVGGRFDCGFMLSKEINYEVGYGRLAIVATSDDGRDVLGVDEQILIGGIIDDVDMDTEGPSIKMWIDYKEFVDGQQTGATPVLYAVIEDEQGINVTGQGVGHDITLVIDGDRANALSLNNFFVYETGVYTRGLLTFQLDGLDDGPHSLTLKAWDNLNNSNSVSVAINSAAKSAIHFGTINLLMVNGHLMLDFSHDCAGQSLSVDVRAYSLSGTMVANGTINVVESGNQSGSLDLTQLVPGLEHLARGCYLVRCEVRGLTRQGSFTKKIICPAQ